MLETTTNELPAVLAQMLLLGPTTLKIFLPMLSNIHDFLQRSFGLLEQSALT